MAEEVDVKQIYEHPNDNVIGQLSRDDKIRLYAYALKRLSQDTHNTSLGEFEKLPQPSNKIARQAVKFAQILYGEDIVEGRLVVDIVVGQWGVNPSIFVLYAIESANSDLWSRLVPYLDDNNVAIPYSKLFTNVDKGRNYIVLFNILLDCMQSTNFRMNDLQRGIDIYINAPKFPDNAHIVLDLLSEVFRVYDGFELDTHFHSPLFSRAARQFRQALRFAFVNDDLAYLQIRRLVEDYEQHVLREEWIFIEAVLERGMLSDKSPNTYLFAARWLAQMGFGHYFQPSQEMIDYYGENEMQLVQSSYARSTELPMPSTTHLSHPKPHVMDFSRAIVPRRN